MKSFAKLIWNVLLLALVWQASFYHETGIYIYHQAHGQFKILFNKETFADYRNSHQLSKADEEKLDLIEKLKQYSVDSLAYRPTSNFTSIYDQGNEPLLWAITASDKYVIEPFYWHFPIVGSVSYKGFFDKKKAIAEKNRLVCLGYDVDLRTVSAWSTLGWFSDPVLSSMLKRSKGGLCNLIFHELFHSTYYAKSSVDFNENLASFIAHKATIQYLQRRDTVELRSYLNNYNDNLIIDDHISKRVSELHDFYDRIKSLSDARKMIARLEQLNEISVSVEKLPLSDPQKARRIRDNILHSKNAWFVDFRQYSGLQDSLEHVFNKIYKSDIRKMVQSLK